MQLALRLVWYSAEVIVTNPGTGWANGAKVESSWKSLPHGWELKYIQTDVQSIRGL